MADLIAPHVTQLTTLLLKSACRLIKPIKIDYNFKEVEDEYLFDVAGKRFIKESASLEGPPRAFIRYEYTESGKPLFSTIYRRYTFSLCSFFGFHSVNFKIKGRSQRFLFATFKLLPRPKLVSHFITPDIIFSHTLSPFITPYPLRWKQNQLIP